MAVSDINVSKNRLALKIHEAKTLARFCHTIIQLQYGLNFNIFDGYFVNYSIKQIGKEFDLLRVSDDFVINIELKSQAELEKIKNQMEKNYYYLKLIAKEVAIYTYLENEYTLYKYNTETKEAVKTDFLELINNLTRQQVNDNINPDDLFKPANYLISPFSKTQRFLNDEYFLNNAQQSIKNEIMQATKQNKPKYFCLAANAGTGKTLLLYDIAKTILNAGKSPAIFHCGKLNAGHLKLIAEHNYNILPIVKINENNLNDCIPPNTTAVFIDEAQRINDEQLNLIIKRTGELNVAVLFCYDKKQFLQMGEDKDIYEYLKQNYLKPAVIKKTLTNKIRTNKEMVLFIKHLFNKGRNYFKPMSNNVSIEYFDNFENAEGYIRYLCSNKGWQAITYTNYLDKSENIDKISAMAGCKAHDVIGQEFDKVVFIMDKNFSYDDNGKLQMSDSYYSLGGMLYQIVTRAVNELKIIVLDNPILYLKLTGAKI
ncbi:MAG: DUF2075 domain-containing protein [Spirochaetaceae bacterium]|nr:DUF2075 domain-containing protein [Spirochaetaceae bacterium]